MVTLTTVAPRLRGTPERVVPERVSSAPSISSKNVVASSAVGPGAGCAFGVSACLAGAVAARCSEAVSSEAAAGALCC